MAISEEVKIFVTAETAKTQADIKKLMAQMDALGKTSKSTGGAFSEMRKVMGNVAVVAGTLYTAYRTLIKPASDLEEQHSKFTTVFRENIKEAEKWADTLVDAYAMSRREAYQYLASVQDLLKPMGIQPQLAAQMSNQVVKLAADLGSFNNLPTGQVIADINSALVNNFETVKKYGIVLNETTLKQEAFNMGLYSGKGAIDQQTKAQVALRLIMKGSSDAIGDMARTSDSFANVFKKVLAGLENAGASIGAEVLPGLTKLGTALLNVAADGGFLVESFKNIAKAANVIITSIANIINALVALQSNADQKRVSKSFDNLAEKQKAWGENAEKIFGKYKKDGEGIAGTVERMAKGTGIMAEAAKIAKKEWDDMGTSLSGLTDKQQKLRDVEFSARDAIDQGLEKEKAALDAKIAARKAETQSFIDSEVQKGNATDARLNKEMEKQKEADKKFVENLQTRNQSELDELTLEYEGIKERKLLQDEEMLLLEQEYQERRKELIFEKNLEIANQSIQTISNMSNAIGAILNQDSKNRQMRLDSDYNKQKAKILASVTDEEARKLALEKLDEKFDKKKRALQREQARRQKALAIMSAVINTAQGITAALANPGGIAGIVLAAIVGALGAVQIGLIASEPIAAESGALIKGSIGGTPMIAGEKGKSEMIVPFENEEVQDRIGGMTGSKEPGVTLNIQNFYALGDAQEMARMIDRELYKLKQDRNSAFATSIIEG